MAAPIVSAPRVRGGEVQLVFTPPLKFIAKQSGAFSRGLKNLDRLWNRLVPLIVSIETDQFATAGRGNPWKPLAASTLAEKLRLGYPSDTLVRTGDLRDSLTDPARAKETGPGYLAWKTDVPYAGFHQEPSRPGRPPKREVIDITISDRRRFEAAVVGWINEVSAETWGRS